MKDVLVVDAFHPSVFLRKDYLEERTSFCQFLETFLKCSFKLAFAVAANASIGRKVTGLGTYHLRMLLRPEGLKRRWQFVAEEDMDSESLEPQL